nr:hypothetical protein [Pararhizobium sp. IMCC21322]
MPLRIKRLFEIEGIWGRAVVVEVLELFDAFGPFWCVVALDPPQDIGWPFTAFEPGFAERKRFAVETFIGEVEKGLRVFPQRQCGW